MSLLTRARAILPPASHATDRRVRLAAAPVVALIVAIGVWVTGGLLTDDAAAAKLLTTAWLALTAAAAGVAAWRWRDLALPVIAAYLVVALGLGGYLLYASEVDRVVDEPVASVERDGQRVASGAFRGLAHPTEGTATVLRRPDGSRVLTMTDFGTDPGPDLRVYLVPQRGADVTGAVDLGPLKGNRGDQQYALPADARAGAVVIWCRAFSVAFGVAELSAGGRP